MIKHYCDVCGREIVGGIGKTLEEVRAILDIAGVDDICKNCLDKAERVDWDVTVKNAIYDEVARK